MGVQVPPRTRRKAHIGQVRLCVHLDDVGLLFEGELETEVPVDVGLVGGVGVATHRGDDGGDLGAGHPGAPCRLAQSGLGHHALSGDLGDPAGDQGRVGAGFQRDAVSGEALVALGQAAAGGLAFGVLAGVVGAGVGEAVQGVGQPGWGEDLGQPRIQGI